MIHASSFRLNCAAVLSALVLAGCAGSGASVSEPPSTLPEPAPTLAEQETFDVSAYTDPPVAASPQIAHDVPAALMENRLGEGISRRVQGYRVQVASTTDADEARRLEEEVRSYWASLARRFGPGSDLPRTPRINLLFRQPYYRIRLGDFEDRGLADEAARLMDGRFPGSFAVPDEVTIE